MNTRPLRCLRCGNELHMPDGYDYPNVSPEMLEARGRVISRHNEICAMVNGPSDGRVKRSAL